MKVYVYYNLHRKLWSIKALEGPHKGRVVAHKHHVVLCGVTPKVSQAGRARVLRDKRKNVHAGLVGQWVHSGPLPTTLTDWTEITYNPYKYTSFVHKDTEQEYCGSSYAYLADKRVYIL